MTWRLEELRWLTDAPSDFRARCDDLDASATPSGTEILQLANSRLDTNQLTKLSKSITRAREKSAALAPLTPFHLGLLGNGTTCLFAPVLPAAAARHRVLLKITQAEYDQVTQQALNPASTLNTSKVDAILLALDFHSLPFDGNGGALSYLKMIREGIARGAGVPVIFQTIVCPPAPLFGSLDGRVNEALRRQVHEFNSGLQELAAANGDYVLDISALAETVGTQNWQDPAQWNMYKLPFAQSMVPIYAEYVARLLGAIRGHSRKCLVLDLDNTIWGGVIGDDGLDGIVIGQGDGVAEAFLEVQRVALTLRERGIILAVCSKNTDATARKPFREHPDMLLKEEHIAVFQANWSDKSTNLEAIAKTLNIGLDSLVFVDDNPVERSHVREHLPMVAVPELPADASFYARTILNAGYFEAVSFSDDDRGRAAAYQANAQRAELASGARDMDAFLTSLDMKIEFNDINSVSLVRVTQLINKTNQFNLTTRRYTQAEVEALIQRPEVTALQIRLVDRFGDNGIIGVVMACQNGDEFEIDTWLMSCRVLGRRVEEAVMEELVRRAKLREAKTLIGRFISSGKNDMVSDHYEKLEFTKSEGTEADQKWSFSVDTYKTKNLPFRT